MKRKHGNRLKLARKTVRRLDSLDLARVSGRDGVLPSVSCTQNPDLPTSTGRLGFRRELEL